MIHSDETMNDAFEAGRSDMYFDGLYLPGLLPCQCELCLAEYARGQRWGEIELYEEMSER